MKKELYHYSTYSYQHFPINVVYRNPFANLWAAFRRLLDGYRMVEIYWDKHSEKYSIWVCDRGKGQWVSFDSKAMFELAKGVKIESKVAEVDILNGFWISKIKAPKWAWSHLAKAIIAGHEHATKEVTQFESYEC